MNFGSISYLYLLSKTSKKSGMKISLFGLKSFSQGGTGQTGGVPLKSHNLYFET
jgi:hypothetical protein